MLIFDENVQPVILDSIYAPTVTDCFWVLDLNLLDFKLTPLTIIEQSDGPTFMVSIEGFEFPVPTNWNILVVDEDSMILDVIQLAEAAGRLFKSFVYGTTYNPATRGYQEMSMARTSEITVRDYFPSFPNICPALNKHQMLCHPVSPGSWVCISNSDTYNKYLKDKVVGDLI